MELKNILISAITALVVVFGWNVLVGNDQGNLGGATRFPNSDVSAQTITSTGAFTASAASSFTGDATFDTTTLFVDVSADSVGVGTTSPDAIFHIEDNAATTTALLESGGAGLGGRIIMEDYDGAGCSEAVVLNGSVTWATVTCP